MGERAAVQRYILRRLLQGLITLFVMSVLVFFTARLTGDPLDVLLPVEATQEDYDRMARVLGLDKPLPVQYGLFIRRAVQGDLGKSIRAKRPVTELIGQRLPNSVKLVVVSVGFAMVLAFGLGGIAAVKKGTWVDGVARVIGTLGMSMPAFWLGILLLLLLGVKLGLLPVGGLGGPAYYIMPAFTLGWVISAGMMRLFRSAMVEALDEEYIKLARVKGVTERGVVWRHALRNALIPVITFAGFYFATLIGAAVVIETVFTWPGLGRLAFESVIWRDYPLIQGVVLTIASIVLIVNLIVDLLYAYIDPRIRY
jgi:peptide/nickel transport system permease protein